MGIIKIPTVSQSFSTTANSMKVSTGDSNNDRQPEMAAETGNSYISGTMTALNSNGKMDKSGIFDHGEPHKSVAKCLRQRRTTESGNIAVSGANLVGRGKHITFKFGDRCRAT